MSSRRSHLAALMSEIPRPLICATYLLLAATISPGQTTFTVTKPSGFAISPPVSQLPDNAQPHASIVVPFHPLPRRSGNSGQTDTALQTSAGPLVRGNPRAHFAGIGSDGVAPPDPNIAVGPNYIVQTVNS